MPDEIVSRYCDAIAPEWDTLRAGYFSDAVREAAIARAYLRPEMVVADVGGGSGFMATGLAPLVTRVHVIESAPAMLAVARRNLAQFANVIFHYADGERLPLADGAVDAVFANMDLHHCRDPQMCVVSTRIVAPSRPPMATTQGSVPRTSAFSWRRAANALQCAKQCKSITPPLCKTAVGMQREHILHLAVAPKGHRTLRVAART
ncbi:MAG: class I SAM-dependent methyltransferase [Anaerolineae bacterium]